MTRAKTALVLGGAACVHEDIAVALKLFKPDLIVAVKDIGITWPEYHSWITMHPERVPRELARRRAAGLPDPREIVTYQRATIPRGITPPITWRRMDVKGGSSGMLGVEAALTLADRVVLAGIPLDPKQVHYSRPKKGGWPAAEVYKHAWLARYESWDGRVRSVSGWTRELLGFPDEEWLRGRQAGADAS